MTTGLIVMAYGTPSTPDQVRGYYTHIRRGRPPEPEQLAELQARYAAIGGISPLLARTAAQVGAITTSLEEIEPGKWLVALGNKHAAPFVEDGVADLARKGVERIVGLVLAPHFSEFSVGKYHARAHAAADMHSVPFCGIESWHLTPELISFQTAAVEQALADLPERTKVVFTAHSLPERLLVDDPYPDQLEASAREVADHAGLDSLEGWGLGWQSAGRTPEQWRGPDILEIIRDLAGNGRSDGILVVPQGFTSDHLEVVYDLDIEAAALAAELGLAFARTAVVNAEPTVMAALARKVISQ